MRELFGQIHIKSSWGTTEPTELIGLGPATGGYAMFNATRWSRGYSITLLPHHLVTLQVWNRKKLNKWQYKWLKTHVKNQVKVQVTKQKHVKNHVVSLFFPIWIAMAARLSSPPGGSDPSTERSVPNAPPWEVPGCREAGAQVSEYLRARWEAFTTTSRMMFRYA